MPIVLQESSVLDAVKGGQTVISPVTILRELIENAIDANSKSIGIFVDDGECFKIIVEDDGCGIEKEDSDKLFLDGCSSKNQDGSSYGYKGSALKSISSVCQEIILESKSKDSSAFSVRCSDGVMTKVPMFRSSIGTKIIISNPFYKTPIRLIEWRRKKEAFCTEMIEEIKKYYIFHNLRVRFQLCGLETKTFALPANESLQCRLMLIFAVSRISSFSTTIDNFDIVIYLLHSCPHHQVVYINRRRCKMKVFLPNMENFGYVLIMTCSDPNLFQDSAKSSSIGAKLFMNCEEKVQNWISSLIKKSNKYEESKSIDITPTKPKENITLAKNIFEEIKTIQLGTQTKELLTRDGLRNLSIIGQFNQAFIIAESLDDHNELLIIDQHAIDERINYELLKCSMSNSGNKTVIDRKQLFWDAEKLSELEKCIPEIRKFGFNVQFDADGAYLLSVPLKKGIAFSENGIL